MIPRGLTDEVRSDWTALASPTRTPDVFDPCCVAQFPEPVRRWLHHAIAPGTPLARTAEVRMHGEVRLGEWRSFTAVQRMMLSGGFVWAATARMAGLPVIGFDRYTRGIGQMRWKLLKAVTVMRAEGSNVTRSAAGRYAGELLVYLPAAALSKMINWRSVDETRATAVLEVGSTPAEVTITVGASGALAELALQRWGNPGGASFAEYPFGATFQDQIAFAGFRLPREVTAGWHYGTPRWAEGEFIRYTIDDVHYS
jgi:hypothetical protein